MVGPMVNPNVYGYCNWFIFGIIHFVTKKYGIYINLSQKCSNEMEIKSQNAEYFDLSILVDFPRKIQLQTQKETAQKRLDELKKQAKKQFGTDDLDELQEKLEEMKDSNAKQLSEYQSSLDAIEKKLVEIDES